MWIRLIILLAYFACLAFLIRKSNKAKVLFIISSLITLVLSPVSLFAIENGLYISELGKDSYETGAMFRAIIFYLIFFTTFVFSFKKVKIDKAERKQNYRIKKLILKYLPFVTIAALLYGFVDIFISGVPLLDSSMPNKMNYFGSAASLPFVTQAFLYITLFSPILLALYYCDQKKKMNKIITVVLLALSAVYVVLLGFKSSGLQNILFGFAIPVIYLKMILGKTKVDKKKIFIGAGIFVAVLAGAVTVNYTVYNYSNTSVLDQVANRTLALGSHVWWATDDYRQNNMITADAIVDNFGDNLTAIVTNRSVYDPRTGVAKIMTDLAPEEKVNYFLENKTRFATSVVATHVYDYGYMLAALWVVIYALLYSWLIMRFIKHIAAYDFVGIILLYKIISSLETFLWGSGTVTDLINYRIIIFALAYAVYIAVKKVLLKKSKEEQKEQK